MFNLFPYADLTRLATWEGIAAGGFAITAVGLVACVIATIGVLPFGTVSMPLAYLLRGRKGLSDEDNVGLDIFSR
ncbi:MAG: hypothetical protein ACM3KF_03045 [Acidobacteriota bacterium]